MLHFAVRPATPSFHRPGDHVYGRQPQAGTRSRQKSQANRGEAAEKHSSAHNKTFKPHRRALNLSQGHLFLALVLFIYNAG